MSQTELTTKEIKFKIEIAAPVEKVWNAIINDINKWWRGDFYFYQNSEIIFEAVPGGRIYEQGEGIAGGMWYNVLNINPNESLQLVGNLSPQFGGPATSFFNITLERAENSTILNITDHIFGAISEETKNQLDSGWKYLFEEGLKKYLEN